MPVKRTRPKKQDVEHTHLALRVECYEADIDASVNHYAYDPQYAWDLDDSEPVYKFGTRLIITATSIQPEKRAGEIYELTFSSDNAPSRRLVAMLRDLQVRDKNGSLEYRQYRGKEVPVYRAPKGLGTLDKTRGAPCWTAWLFVPAQFTSDLLILLGRERAIFVSLHERKESRQRWIQSITLQTTDPSEE